MEFFHGTKIDFLSKRKAFFLSSAFIFVFGIIAIFVIGPKFGIDFIGGTEMAVRFSPVQSIESVRSTIDKAGFIGSEIKSYGTSDEFLIRLNDGGDKAVSTKVTESLKKAYPNTTVTVLKLDRIGPKVGDELRIQASIAVVLAVISIMLYIAFRFEFIYGIGAIVALIHDVVFAIIAIVIVQKLGIINLEINQASLAAILTVLGYSINDTVIVFDRIRENKELHKGMKLVPLINLSINETLSRTLNTVLTVVVVLTTMTILGGEVLQGFAFTMLVGILIGTYSSIYIASATVVWYLEKVRKVPVDIPASEIDKKLQNA
ncbi:MAG: protein translocase subunit SecF [Candidatus Kapabacteria bacterium]|nr:protein translocase subunit SecF [Candidatus Kapabacteria bacterium]